MLAIIVQWKDDARLRKSWLRLDIFAYRPPPIDELGNYRSSHECLEIALRIADASRRYARRTLNRYDQCGKDAALKLL
jgi:hypothetical protein